MAQVIKKLFRIVPGDDLAPEKTLREENGFLVIEYSPEDKVYLSPDQCERLGMKEVLQVPANRLREAREERCLSLADLARRAGLSSATLARIEQGQRCRMGTKRKILEALGLSLNDRKTIFGEEF